MPCTHTHTTQTVVCEGLCGPTSIVLWALFVGPEHLDGGESLDLVLATQALVLVSVHSPHLDHTLQGRGGGREGDGWREGGVEGEGKWVGGRTVEGDGQREEGGREGGKEKVEE